MRRYGTFHLDVEHAPRRRVPGNLLCSAVGIAHVNVDARQRGIQKRGGGCTTLKLGASAPGDGLADSLVVMSGKGHADERRDADPAGFEHPTHFDAKILKRRMIGVVVQRTGKRLASPHEIRGSPGVF
jgi:hypothetical protein